MTGGYGQLGQGRSEYGQAKSDVETRFDSSVPTDGSTEVLVGQTYIKTLIYNYSSRVQEDDTLLLRVSEDGGSNYSDAYLNGVFVAPYNGSNSKTFWADSQTLVIAIERTSIWPESSDITVEVTAFDEYGQVATKITPVKWS